MKTSDKKYKDVGGYISKAPKEVQSVLKQIRSTIVKNAPKAEESISYGMPGYKLYGKPLVYFAAFPKHIGFYATPNAHNFFKKELSKYKQGKGSVQFPIDEKIPLALIVKIVKFNAKKIKDKQVKNK